MGRSGITGKINIPRLAMCRRGGTFGNLSRYASGIDTGHKGDVFLRGLREGFEVF